MDSIKNKLRNIRLRWYGHILRMENSYFEKNMIAMGVSNKEKRGRPKRRFMDAIKDNMKVARVNEQDAIVIQFPSGVVPSAEMAGFTPCMGIYWSEIFLQGACPCLPPTSVF